MTESRKELRSRLQQKLRELFQFNVSDLDFGIYRILNRKKDEIEQFIEEDLLNAIDKGLEAYQKGDREKFEAQLKNAKNKIPDIAFDEDGSIKEDFEGFENVVRYNEAKNALEDLNVSEEIEKRIYNDLYTFFSRYYDNGDFVTQRRISTRDSKYAIPYNGEEVKLHWANKDQYYIKTGEHFTDYKFEADGLDIWFKLKQAETEKDNVKESDTRYFILSSDDPIEIDEDENKLTFWFEYRPFKDEEEERWLKEYNKVEKSRKTLDRQALCIAFDEWIRNELSGKWRDVLSTIPANKERSLLFGRLNHYTGKNTTDYFIHKNLQDFLERELEYYLKQEVIRVDDFIEGDSEQPMQAALIRAKVVRGIGEKVITFLSQIENFQKKLFEKKKFVVDTHYCFTLDKVPEKLYETILENKEQLTHWEELYAVDEWENTLEWNGNWTKASLKNHPFMMIDTRFFSEDFKYELLSSFDDLDEELGGLLINGENYQGLNILNEKYIGKIKQIYIDPPYNSKSSEIIYKNTYKHSSWLSLMENRIATSQKLLRNDAIYTVAIDENEQEGLGYLLKELFNTANYDHTCVSVIHNPGGIQGTNFSYTHEFAYFIYPNDGEYIGKVQREDADKTSFRDWGGEESKREAARNCFYPIFVKNNRIVGFGDICDEDFHPESGNIENDDGTISVYPIDGNGVERKWRFAKQTVESIQKELKCEEVEGVKTIFRYKSLYRYKTVWTHKKYNSNVYGSQLLNNIIPDNEFTFPKSLFNTKEAINAATHDDKNAFVLDYFSGSGTTGHAVLNINKEDEGNRKYILIEMGQYFNTVLKPRLQKVVFSDNWKDGVPQDKNGQSHAFKYHFIESYEDALNNIDFKRKEDTQEAMKFDDYMLKYMLDFETQGVSATLLKEEAFKTPFDYKLNIQRGHETPKEEKVDLVETFHYLIGLWLKTIRRHEHQDRKYAVSQGEVRSEDAIEDVLVIWRSTEDLDLDKEAKWIKEEFIGKKTFDRIYINGASKVKDAQPTEITFREKMFEEVT